MHTITYLNLNPPFSHGARCKCGWNADPETTRQKVEDQVMRHAAYIQRVRTQLRVKNPSLRGERDHYRKMASDPNVNESERALWNTLAAELDARLNDAGQTEQTTLPFGVDRKRRSDLT